MSLCVVVVGLVVNHILIPTLSRCDPLLIEYSLCGQLQLHCVRSPMKVEWYCRQNRMMQGGHHCALSTMKVEWCSRMNLMMRGLVEGGVTGWCPAHETLMMACLSLDLLIFVA